MMYDRVRAKEKQNTFRITTDSDFTRALDQTIIAANHPR